ncbi:MAG: UDP-glucose 4-epimerase GalE [Planctomycetales bacterium]|nr:UDP-glucose 4-epimerase GalE [Planctomycetales bacterium]
MKILVTGGAGYIGSVAVEHLLEAGHQPVVFDNFSLGHRAAVHPDAELVIGDLASPSDLDGAFRTHAPEAVMHFAAHAAVGESMRDPMLYLGDNVINGANLLRATIHHDVRKFILSSTANLFDDPDVVPIPESAQVRPGSPYGESKHMLERMLHWLEITHGLRYAALRYFNAAGATEAFGEDHHPELHVIPLVLQCAAGVRDKFTIFGDDYPTADGSCIRDYVHVSDLATAHLAALEALDQGSRRYNLGTGQGASVKQVIAAVEQVTGRSIRVEIGARRPGDPAELVADSTLIQADLGWRPRYTDLHDIVETAWSWRQRHPNGYADHD